ncbi:MAG: hypothetical protein M1822_008775 [Bathelium mastoideum]|nr:MAG: hypothetical protein M1822_008775 [Bathelium mastoideum]
MSNDAQKLMGSESPYNSVQRDFAEGAEMSRSDSSTPQHPSNPFSAPQRPREKKKVGFTSEREAPSQIIPGDASRHGSYSHSRQGSGASLIGPGSASESEETTAVPTSASSIRKPRPAIRKGATDGTSQDAVQADLDAVSQRLSRQPTLADEKSREAHEAAKRLEMDETESVSAYGGSSFNSPAVGPTSLVDDIPLMDLGGEHQELQKTNTLVEAQHLVRSHTRRRQPYRGAEVRPVSVYDTPIEDQRIMDEYVPRPERYRGGILSSLMKLYDPHGHNSHNSRVNSATATPTPGGTPRHSPPTSGTSTPLKSFKHWYQNHSANDSTPSMIGRLVEGSASLGAPGNAEIGEEVAKKMKANRPAHHRQSSNALDLAFKKMGHKSGKAKLDHQIKITIHISEVIQRQRYLLRLCRALMQYGAPTHRLEEYMKMSARVLEIEGQFLYIPGCMIVSFDDSATHTTEVQLVRTSQAVDLGKLSDTHDIYKAVVHDQIDAKEGYDKLDQVLKRPNKHKPWLLVPVYGCAAAAVGPFAFGARLIDLPIAFLLGCILGILQLIVAPASETYSNVFEISAAVLTSFLARAFGSIKGGNVFCFSALAQSSIALILPGYIVLCASLELQSRSIVAGSVRMVYAIIYSLFLGFGITVGTAIYGVFDENASNASTCKDPSTGYLIFLAVPCFTLCLCIINQAKWKQTPIMIIIAFTGYIINYFSSKKFPGNTQVSQTLAAFAIGLMANLYSRLGAPSRNLSLDIWEHRLRPWLRRTRQKQRTLQRKMTFQTLPSGDLSDPAEETRHARAFGFGLAAASMLPAIFVQVPSGLSVGGSLVSGIASANQITGHGGDAGNGTTVVSSAADMGNLNSAVFNVGYSVIQIAIGITCGLFFSALAVYPFGKKRSALFSF